MCIRDRVKTVAVQQEVGYAALADSQNDYKPYLYIQNFDAASFDLLGIRLVSGRMPQNADELLVPEHILTSGGVTVKAVSYTHLDVYKRQPQIRQAGPVPRAGQARHFVHSASFPIHLICVQVYFSKIIAG